MNRKIEKDKLCALALLLCCVLSLFLPRAAARRQEAALLSNVLPRAAQAGALDENAREVPLVYALYRRRFWGSALVLSLRTGQEGSSALARLREKADELEDAGVLPETLANAVSQALEATPCETACGDAGGFCAVNRTLYDGQKKQYSSIECEWHAATGRVVYFLADTDAAQADAAAMLQAYRAYLGLGALNDWQDVGETTGERAACWSGTGQLFLYCYTRDGQLRMGALSRGPEEMAAEAAA